MVRTHSLEKGPIRSQKLGQGQLCNSSEISLLETHEEF